MSETWALLSDIHGNIDALEAVLRDLPRHRVDRVVVLGDIINYGGAPRACVERVMAEADVTILGNHEYALLQPGGQEGMVGAAGAGLPHNQDALQGCPQWQRLIEGATFPEASERMLDGVQLVHGSPRDPVLEYVWPGHSAYFLPFNSQLDQRLLEILDARSAQHTLCGHTHVPAALVPYEARGLFRGQQWNRQFTFLGPNVMFWVPQGEAILEGLSEHPAILNPGSVGQPRDGIPEAAYGIYDGDMLQLCRVPYDIDAAQRRIHELPLEDDTTAYLADRLSRGA